MLTVVVATHNGERTLPTVLEAHAKLRAPDGGWKLVVIDNGSTDSTPQILDRFARVLPMTRLLVAERGKNRALNAGLDAREGDLIVFTDDDTVPSPDWLQTIRRAADRNPVFDIFGGATVPRWEREPERWILDWVPHAMTYSITFADTKEGPLAPTLVCGTNMTVRARVFDAGYRFDVQIGPQAGVNYAMGSETEFTVRMDQNGHKAWFVEGAAVEHMVRAFQMERGWVLSRAVRYGRCMYRRDRQRGEKLPALMFGVPRWQFRQMVRLTLTLARATLSGDAERAFKTAWQMCFDWGYMREARRTSKGGAQS